MTIEQLYKIILERKKKNSKDSYVASLFRKGNDRIAQKVGEEAIEVIIAAKSKGKKRITEEMADLWFHSLVLLANAGITPTDVFAELEKRHRKLSKKYAIIKKK